MRNNHHCFLRRNGDFKIFSKSAKSVHPCECSFDNPAPWELFPFMGLDLFRDIDRALQFRFHFTNECTSISCIRTESFDGRILFTGFLSYCNTRFCIVKICCMNCNCQQVPRCIYNDMSFPAFRFFPPSIPLPSLSATDLTL